MNTTICDTFRFLFKTLLIIHLLLWGHLSYALDPTKSIYLYKHEAWKAEDGLPMNSVLSIAQTFDGYIWLGTESGLARFDGINIEVFNTKNTPVITNDCTCCLMVDRNGTLWIGTRGGGIVLYKNRTFEAFIPETELLSNEVWRIIESVDGSIWIGSRNGLNCLIDGKLTVVELPKNISNRNIRALIEDRYGRIWMGTRGGGLILIKKKGEIFESEAKGFDGVKISSLLEDRLGNIWVGTMEYGLILMQAQKSKFFNTKNGLSSNHVRCIQEDQDGNLWIGTNGGGINRIQEGGKQISSFNFQHGLTSNSILSLFEDREKILWIGTEGGGLNYLRDSKIFTYTTQNGLSNNLVVGIFQDSQKSVWVGSIGFGINRFKNGQFRSWSTQDGLSSNQVVSICEYPNGTLWFGTLGGGINQFFNGRFKNFTKAHGLSDNFIRTLYVDRNKTLWAGTDRGTVHYFSNGRFVLYKNVNFRVNVIFKDSNNNLWVGTWGSGLILLKNERMEIYTNKNRLSGNNVMAIYEDHEGIIWIGTYDGGLNRLKDEKFDAVTQENGLPDKTIYCILEDNRNNLWMSSNRGIFRLGKQELDLFFAKKLKIINPHEFGKEDGMKSIECNGGSQPAGWQLTDGALWFPTTHGISVIYPETLLVNPVPPTIQIEKIFFEGKEYSLSEKTILLYGKGELMIHYKGISFIRPDKISFKYKMDGVNSDWFDAGTERKTSFKNLDSGTYCFNVVAYNQDGVGNSTKASVCFQWKYKFYQTFIFKIILVLFVFFILCSFYFLIKRYIAFRKIKSKYKKSPLSEKEVEKCIAKLLHLIEVEKVYKDSNISLRSFSEKLMIHPRYISQLINERLKKNFFELINGYRIEEAKKILVDLRRDQMSIIDIGFEVGFNSKSAFNRAFKYFTKMTPSQYKKRYKIGD